MEVALHVATDDRGRIRSGSCNRAMESTDFKASVRSAFEAYQLAVRPCFDLLPFFLPIRTEKYPSFYPLTPAAAGIGVWGKGPAFEVPFSTPALR